MKTLVRLLFLLCLLSSFGGELKIFKNTSLWLPEGFDSRNTILLIKTFSTGRSTDPDLEAAEDEVTDDMKFEMQRLYPYKYEFVRGNEVSSNHKYANTDVYRYVIMESNGGTSMPSTSYVNTQNPNSAQRYRTGDKNFGLSVHDFHIYDRKLDKSYSPTGHPTNTIQPVFSNMINTIAVYLHGLTGPPAALPSGNGR